MASQPNFVPDRIDPNASFSRVASLALMIKPVSDELRILPPTCHSMSERGHSNRSAVKLRRRNFLA